MSTTSGCRSRTRSSASPPVGRLAEHGDVGLGVEQRAQPGPQQCLVVGEHDADHGATAVGKLADHAQPAERRRLEAHLAAERCRPLPHTPDAVALGERVGGTQTAAVVVDGDDEPAGPVLDGDLGPVGPGVPHHVGHRLLHHPVGRELHPRRERFGRAGDVRREVESGVPGALDEVVEGGEAGGRMTRGRAVALAEHLDERAQLDQGLLARALDDAQGLVDLLGVGAAQVQGHRGLHVDEGHVVGDHVVQLLGDPEAILARPAAALLGQRSAMAEGSLAADAAHLGEGEHEQRPGEGRRGRSPRPPPGRVERGGQPVGDQHATSDEPRDQPVPGEHGRHEHDDEREHHRAVRVAEHEVGAGGSAHDDGHDRHPGAGHQGQRDGAGEQERDGEQVERAATGLGLRRAQAADELHDREDDGQEDLRWSTRAPRVPASPRGSEPGIRHPAATLRPVVDRHSRRAGGRAGHASSLGTSAVSGRPAHGGGAPTPPGVCRRAGRRPPGRHDTEGPPARCWRPGCR